VAILAADVPARPGKSFATSAFKVLYDQFDQPEHQYEVLKALDEFLRLAVPQEHCKEFFKVLQQEALTAAVQDGALSEVEKIATLLWSSASRAKGKGGREMCSYLNQAIREDHREQLQTAMPLIRSINQLCVTRGSLAEKWPPNDITYRGVGLPTEHRIFFEEGRKYRANMFLATSFSEGVAKRFAINNSSPEKLPTIFYFHYDASLRCVHVNFIKSLIPSESEFLFPPYAVFTVRSADFKTPGQKGLSEIHLDVAPDNKLEDENLPLSPWH
jgi:hypothetical protein